MEIKLTFKEEKFRSLYKNIFLLAEDEVNNKLQSYTKAKDISFILAGISFFMTLVDRHWITLTFILLLFALFCVWYPKTVKRKLNKSIEQGQKEIDEFVAKVKSKSEMKYTWDSDMIRYYEDGELKDEYLWKDLVYQKSEFESITLYFSSKPTVWIPRIVVEDKEELAKFENSIQENLNNRERAD